MGVVLYKIIFHLEKEQAKQVSGLEQDNSENGQEKRGILKAKPDSDNDLDGYKDDEPDMWNGQPEEIEMRRSSAVQRALSPRASGGIDSDMVIV